LKEADLFFPVLPGDEKTDEGPASFQQRLFPAGAEEAIFRRSSAFDNPEPHGH